VKNNIAIQIENLSKQYRLGVVGTGTLSHDLNRWWARMRGKEDPTLKIGQENVLARNGAKGQGKGRDYIWALRDINLEVKQGEVLGIIGKNGAGKSTLLKILSRVTGPTTGTVKVNGKIASLLEVGTGFHPELTGRENIFLNGAILGMRKQEIRAKLDEIIDFAGVAKYVDTPVKRYSSGMYVRLAFAVAAHLEPDILVVDEVLAVGDAEFQKKAVGKMQDVSKGEGRTVLFVSHNMASVKSLCKNTIILENGKTIFEGETILAIDHYINRLAEKSREDLSERIDRKGGKSFRYTEIKFLNVKGLQTENIISGENIIIELDFKAERILHNVVFRVQFVNQEGILMFVCNNFHSSEPFREIKPDSNIRLEIKDFPLPFGRYYVHLQCLENLQVLDEIEFATEINVIKGDFFGTGKLPDLIGGVYVKHKWYIHE
jgi:lipopolysaccharide transport system ATP-binding protein